MDVIEVKDRVYLHKTKIKVVDNDKNTLDLDSKQGVTSKAGKLHEQRAFR